MYVSKIHAFTESYHKKFRLIFKVILAFSQNCYDFFSLLKRGRKSTIALKSYFLSFHLLPHYCILKYVVYSILKVPSIKDRSCTVFALY